MALLAGPPRTIASDQVVQNNSTNNSIRPIEALDTNTNLTTDNTRAQTINNLIDLRN